MTVKVLGVEELDIQDLVSYPGNARRGDVKAIAESIRANGQYRPIVVRRRERRPDMILCGHHVRDAVVMTGQMSVRAEVIECDDETARRVHLADNRLSDLASWDEGALVFQLEEFDGNFAGTGFTLADVEKLFLKGMPEPGDADTEDDGAEGWGIVVELDSEDEQAEWLAKLAGEGLRVRALMQ